MKLIQFVLLRPCLVSSSGVVGESLHIAAVPNFIGPMKALIKEFESQTNHHVKASYGSSGKIYAKECLLLYSKPDH